MAKRLTSILLAALILFTSCASTTLLQTDPSDANVYIAGERAGSTPLTYSDTKIVGTCTSLRFEKEGYETLYTNLCRNEEADVGAIIGGVFLLVPFLWTMKYKPTHTYELIPSKPIESQHQGEHESSDIRTKEKLRALKKLQDDGIITAEEYADQKKRILDE